MGEEVKLSVIKKTQDSLGKFIKRPPLTEKLLKKPPFRFLHDIITAVIRQHGLMDGLFTAEEMTSENVKDKESKIAFLQKVIETMKLLTGPNLTVRPSKIVAGQEVEKTNELLQAIAKALEKKLNSKKAVEQVLGKSKDASESVTKVSNGGTSKTKEHAEVAVNGKPTSRRKESKAGTEKKERTNKPGSKESSRKSKDSKVSNESKIRKSAPAVEAEPPVELEPEILGDISEVPGDNFGPSAPQLTPEDPTPSLPPQLVAEDGQDQPVELNNNVDISTPGIPELQELASTIPAVLGSLETQQQPSPSPERPVTVSASRAPTAVPSTPTTARPPSTRPGSAKPRPITARPAAPRLKERVVRPAREEAEPTPDVGSSANLIPDSSSAKPADDDDDEVFVVEETLPITQDPVVEVLKPNVILAPEQPQGHLVTQIIGTQRELEQQADGGDQTGESEWPQWSGKEGARREVSKLREAVQNMVRAANPLGRLLDFLQEDVESMQLELEQWQTENQQLRASITREKQVTSDSLLPLQRELGELTNQVDQQRQNLAALKTNVLSNDRKLNNLLLND